jgi:hypothetical protein
MCPMASGRLAATHAPVRLRGELRAGAVETASCYRRYPWFRDIFSVGRQHLRRYSVLMCHAQRDSLGVLRQSEAHLINFRMASFAAARIASACHLRDLNE